LRRLADHALDARGQRIYGGTNGLIKVLIARSL
jgi:alkylation response protein AidB-like acyl-CoA dehydrogenase